MPALGTETRPFESMEEVEREKLSKLLDSLQIIADSRITIIANYDCKSDVNNMHDFSLSFQNFGNGNRFTSDSSFDWRISEMRRDYNCG